MGKLKKLPESKCNIPCKEPFESTMCGGKRRKAFSVYELNVPKSAKPKVEKGNGKKGAGTGKVKNGSRKSRGASRKAAFDLPFDLP